MRIPKTKKLVYTFLFLVFAGGDINYKLLIDLSINSITIFKFILQHKSINLILIMEYTHTYFSYDDGNRSK